MNIQTDIDILEHIGGIELSQMDSIKLMNRIDTKYLTDTGTLEEVLARAFSYGYLAFELSGKKVHDYKSLYFDTPSLQMYLDHHNGKMVRQKLRTRCYGITGQTFLELKSKNNHGRTKKKRVEIAPEQYFMKDLTQNQVQEWLEGMMIYPTGEMSPTLETVFNRITLVNPEMTERSTIDFNIRFNNIKSGNSADMGNLAVIEVKQDGNSPSKMRDILLELRVKPVRISKYCVGTALTDDTVRTGRFKQKLMLINKMKYD